MRGRAKQAPVRRWGMFARGGMMAGGLFRVFSPDERCPGLHHICHCVKYERNRTIRGRVIAIKLIGLGRRPPFWIIEKSIFGRFHTLRNRLSTHTPNLVKIFPSAAKICPQYGIRKTPPSDGIRLMVSRFTTVIIRRRSYVSPCETSARSDDRRPSYSDLSNSRWPLSAILDI